MTKRDMTPLRRVGREELRVWTVAVVLLALLMLVSPSMTKHPTTGGEQAEPRGAQ